MYCIGFENFITLHVTTMFIVQFLTLSLENKKKFFEKFVGNHTPTLKKMPFVGAPCCEQQAQ